MLTVIAWVVFVYATFWNIIFWTVAVTTIVERNPVNWSIARVEIIISLAIWIIPGVYLFGVF